MGGEPRFAGIDVSKAQLDVAVRPIYRLNLHDVGIGQPA